MPIWRMPSGAGRRTARCCDKDLREAWVAIKDDLSRQSPLFRGQKAAQWMFYDLWIWQMIIREEVAV